MRAKMGYRKATLVRLSGLEDAAQVDVLEAIATISNDQDDRLYDVSVDALLRLSRRSRPTFYKALNALVEAGYVVIESGQMKSTTSRYSVRLEKLPPPKVDFLVPMWTSLSCAEGVKNLTATSGLNGGSSQKLDRIAGKNLTAKQSKVLPDSSQKLDHKQEINKRSTRDQQEVGRASAPTADASPASSDLFPELNTEPKPKASRRKPETPCPWEEGSAVPEDLSEWCRQNCPSLDPQAEFDAFVGHAHTHDRRCRDWKAAFRTWCNKSKQMRRNSAANSSSRPWDLRSLANGNQDEKDYNDLSAIYG